MLSVDTALTMEQRSGKHHRIYSTSSNSDHSNMI